MLFDQTSSLDEYLDERLFMLRRYVRELPERRLISLDGDLAPLTRAFECRAPSLGKPTFCEPQPSVRGSSVIATVPIEGNANLMQYRVRTTPLLTLPWTIEGGQLQVMITFSSPDQAAQQRRLFDSEYERLVDAAAQMTRAISHHNGRLLSAAKEEVARRQLHLTQIRQTTAAASHLFPREGNEECKN